MSEDIKSTRLTLEYNEELAKKVQREEAREEGLKEGLQEGLQKGLEEGLEKGLEKGVEKGVEETTIKFIKNALKKKLAISDIVELTGVTEEEINKWKELNE